MSAPHRLIDGPKASVTTTTLSVLEDGQTDDAEFLVNSLPEAPEPSQQSTTPRNSPPLPPALDGQSEDRAQSPLRPQEGKYGPLCKDRAFWVASLALILLIAVLVLQILGLQAASKLVQAEEPLISWCSPMLQPFGKALIDGDCHIYAITAHQNSNGIGCLLLPGKQQKSWISLTLVISILALVMEAVDLLILTCVNTTKKMRGVKMRRPWCTMFGGLVVLGITLGFGLMYAQYLPPAITSRVTIVMSIQDMPFFFTGRLETAGLRGALLGWNDGVFSSWGNAYYGYPTT